MMERFRKIFRKDNEKGFTLIELLVVVAIIGILVAIAIPQFAAYKKSAADSGAKSQLRNLAVAMEAGYVSKGAYTSFAKEADLSSYGYVADPNVTVTITPSATSWTATAKSANGTGVTYTWDSTKGGLQ